MTEEEVRELLDRSKRDKVVENLNNFLAERGGDAEPGWADVTMEELYANREDCDRVIRALSMEHDVDYLKAMELLYERFNPPFVSAPLGPGVKVTLRSVLEKTGEFERLDRDVQKMRLAAEEVKEVALADAEAAEPAGEVANGVVYLADSADRAQMLTDAYAIEDAYLRAAPLSGGRYLGEKGRGIFEAEYRQQTQQGVDLVRSLEYAEAQRNVHGKMSDGARAQRHQEAEERAKRAEEREYDEQAAELREQFGR